MPGPRCECSPVNKACSLALSLFWLALPDSEHCPLHSFSCSFSSLLLLSVSLRSGNPPEWVYGFWGQTHFMVGAATKAWKETRHWEDTVLIQTIPPPRCFWLSLFSITSFFSSPSSFSPLFFLLSRFFFFPNKKTFKKKKAHSAQVKNAVFITACLA